MEDTTSESKKRRFFRRNPFGGLFRFFFFFTFGGCIFRVYQDILKIPTPFSSQLQGLQFCLHNFFDPRPFKFRPLRKPPRRPAPRFGTCRPNGWSEKKILSGGEI